MSASPPTCIYETVIYADDTVVTAGFYREVLGLTELGGLGHVGAAFALGDGAVLLIFDPEQASQAGRPVPAHGAHGHCHVAFRVDDADSWLTRLTEHGIALELDTTWPRGGRSLYVRDPAGNSVELVEGEIWPRADA